MEQALRRLRAGDTLGEAAKQFRISRERLSHYIKVHAGAARSDKRWTFNDFGRRRIQLIEGDRVVRLWVLGYEPARLAGLYWDEAHAVLGDHDLAPAFIRRWENVSIRDAEDRRHIFTTDLNAIYAAVHADDTPFDRVYKLIR